MESFYSKCELCPRRCRAERNSGHLGMCRMGSLPIVNLYGLHYGEEPVISGKNGSGTVFFEGCSLGCVFCQNHLISRGVTGKGEVCDPSRLSEIFLELQSKGANNINLVTPMHFAPSVAEAIRISKDGGLAIPVALNISGYDLVSTLSMFDGLADIYLTDFKFYSSELSGMVCGAKDYKEVAQEALDEMVRQSGSPVLGSDGMLKRGVIVRHLMLPGKLFDTKKVLDLLLDRYGEKIIISLMNQYTPTTPAIEAVKKGKLPAGFTGRINPEHYNAMCDYLALSGHPCCFMQETDASGDLFIPNFKT